MADKITLKDPLAEDDTLHIETSSLGYAYVTSTCSCVRLDKTTAGQLVDFLAPFAGKTAPAPAEQPQPLTRAQARQVKPGDKLVVVDSSGSSRYSVGEVVAVSEVLDRDDPVPMINCAGKGSAGMFYYRFAAPVPAAPVVAPTAPASLADFDTEALAHELSSRLCDAKIDPRAVRGRGNPAKLREAAKTVMASILWCKAPGGADLWCRVHWLLDDLADAAETLQSREELKGFMAPVPAGYGTVLGHLVQQGQRPEDMGLKEGIRLARLAKDEGITGMWVDASPALQDICKRVRAYPVAFLVKHLGDVDPDHAVDGGEALMASAA